MEKMDLRDNLVVKVVVRQILSIVVQMVN